jgi:hypothetical protein
MYFKFRHGVSIVSFVFGGWLLDMITGFPGFTKPKFKKTLTNNRISQKLIALKGASKICFWLELTL